MFEDITIRRAANPIFINTTRRLRTPESVKPGRVRNVVIRNVTAVDVVQSHRAEPANAATISGLPEAPHENILLENVTITYAGGGTSEQAAAVPPYPTNYNPRQLGPRPAYGFFVRHVRGLQFRNVKLLLQAPDARPAFAVSDVNALVLDRVDAAKSPPVPGALPAPGLGPRPHHPRLDPSARHPRGGVDPGELLSPLPCQLPIARRAAGRLVLTRS